MISRHHPAGRQDSGIPILSLPALRAVELRHADLPLMERAGEAAAGVALTLLNRLHATVVVLAGPGNNGGDAFVVARLLRERGVTVEVLGHPHRSHPPAQAAAAWQALQATGLRESTGLPEAVPDLIIDGMFGIGITRTIAEPWASWIRWANGSGVPVLSLDVPSGLDAATGVAGQPAIVASRTATFIALKPGLVTADGPDRCGAISVHDLALPEVGATRSGIWLEWTRLAHAPPEVLARRRRVTHKGNFGTAVVIGGAEGMVGAALLAGRAALAVGAGRVVVKLVAQDAPRVDLATPELMLRAAALPIEGADALVVGPGLGTSAQSLELLSAAATHDVPLVLDADALNLIARDPALASTIAQRKAATLATPHPAEAARLLACDTAAIQSDRVAAATAIASRLRAIAILKGAGTIVAYPDGRFDINATGNPALSTAGSGDVLSGMLGALLAQRIDPVAAARIAACLHGAAADALVADGIGPVGVRASEVIERARTLVNVAGARAGGSAGFRS